MPYADPEKLKEWRKQHYQKHRTAILAANTARRAADPEQVKENNKRYRKAYYEKNRVARLAAGARQYRLNKQAILARKRLYQAERYHSDPEYKLAKRLRIRLRSALREGWKAGSAIQLLGCSIIDLRKHIEKKFAPGMSWANYGLKGWHIDHITPLAAFDLSNPDQLGYASHHTNLQPLWAFDNIRKADTLD